MSPRVYNFSAGPAVLPVKVLMEAQAAVSELPGVGSSILEISHRSKAFGAVHEEAKTLLTELLNIPSDYSILFLQGGSSLQFTMVPMNLRGETQTADYILTGSWGKKALAEAQRLGTANVVWDGKADNYSHLPEPANLKFTSGAAYAHFTDNETIQGVEFKSEPDAGSIPLVCDTSSNFLSRPIDVSRYGMIYACAKERGHRWRHGRDRSQRPARAGAEEPAADARLPLAGRKRFLIQHASGVCRLRADARGPVAETGCRRPGKHGPAEPGESEAAVRRARRPSRFLPRACPPR